MIGIEVPATLIRSQVPIDARTHQANELNRIDHVDFDVVRS